MTNRAAVCIHHTLPHCGVRADPSDRPLQRAGLYFQDYVDFGSCEASLREENSQESCKKR